MSFNTLKAFYRRLPNIQKLKTFGCRIYPNLCSFHKIKFSNRTNPHIFVGYPKGYNSYMCYHPNIRAIIISQDMIFVENDFSLNSKILVTSLAMKKMTSQELIMSFRLLIYQRKRQDNATRSCTRSSSTTTTTRNYSCNCKQSS